MVLLFDFVSHETLWRISRQTVKDFTLLIFRIPRNIVVLVGPSFSVVHVGVFSMTSLEYLIF